MNISCFHKTVYDSTKNSKMARTRCGRKRIKLYFSNIFLVDSNETIRLVLHKRQKVELETFLRLVSWKIAKTIGNYHPCKAVQSEKAEGKQCKTRGEANRKEVKHENMTATIWKKRLRGDRQDATVRKPRKMTDHDALSR